MLKLHANTTVFQSIHYCKGLDFKKERKTLQTTCSGESKLTQTMKE